MKRNLMIPGVFVIVVVLALLFYAKLQPSQAALPAQQPPPQAYLALEMPNPEDLQAPARLTPAEASRLAAEITKQQAAPFLRELENLRREGDIAGYELLPDSRLIAVHLDSAMTDRARQNLSAIPGASLVEAACAEQANQTLQDMLLGLSFQDAPSPQSLQATNPSINIYAPEWSTYHYIYGSTAANSPVSLRVLRGGSVVASDNTTSSSSGSYYFYPSWVGGSCSSGYNWNFLPGDVVEVTANGNTVSSMVAHLNGWADPINNLVAGQSDPGRTIKAYISQPRNNECNSDGYNLTAPTDGAGYFNASFNGVVDFDGRAWSSLYALDANGNSTYIGVDAWHLGLDNDGMFYGTILPNEVYTATHQRGGSPLWSTTGQSQANGSFTEWLPAGWQAGDVVAVESASVNLDMTVVPLQTTLNPDTNQLTIGSAGGRLVQADFQKRTWGYAITSCDYGDACQTGTTNGSGALTFTPGFDVLRGDYAYVYTYDSAGNFQQQYTNASAIQAGPQWDQVQGYWGAPKQSQSLNLIVWDQYGALKTQDSLYSSSWSGSFSEYPSIDLVAGDQVQVGNGVYSETMTVQPLTGLLNNDSDHLTGQASPGNVLVWFYDYDRTYGYSEDICQTTSATAGSAYAPSAAYNFDLTAYGIEAKDDAEIYFTGPDGHTTYRYAHAFQVEVDNYGNIDGYTMTPGAALTAQLWNGATLVEEKQTTSDPADGWFDLGLTNSPVVGQLVRVIADLSVDLPIVELTINKDSANNRLYGLSPASQPVWVGVTFYYTCYKGSTCGSSQRQLVGADGGGNYSASFQGYEINMWDRNKCVGLQVGEPCSRGYLTYERPDEHSLTYYSPYPPAVSPDAYEADDTAGTAKPYTSASNHTFHTNADVDWIAYTVPADQVGKPLILTTINLGWGVDPVMTLYDTNGTTTLATNDDFFTSGYDARILWTPAAAGAYYIKVAPYNTASAGNCGAAYTFVVFNSQVFLPMTNR